MKNIEEFKKYYFEHKNEFELRNDYSSKMSEYDQFSESFPLDRFGELSLNDYAVGTDNKQSMCYMMEFGKFKHTGPGIGGSTAFKYGIYFSKDKNSFVTRRGVPSNPEQEWNDIRTGIINVLNSVRNAQNADEIKDDYEILKGMPMFLVKLACCYFPRKLIIISGKKHLESVLDLFEIDYPDNYSSIQLAFLINKVIRDSIPELSEDSALTLGNMVWDFYNIYGNDNKEQESILETKYWIYSPGYNASKWDEFYNEGIMALDWNELGDLRSYSSKSEIREKLQVSSNDGSSKKNDTLANWEFANVLKKGDIIYAKRGSETIIGKGIVESDYMYDESRSDFRSYRKVRWVNNEERNHTKLFGHDIVQKTLTDITKYPEYVQKLESLYTNSDSISDNDTTNYLEDVFMSEEVINDITNTLKRKYNIILQGAPGVGKTYCLKKIIYSLMNKKDDSKIKMVQFHQSYSYEDFVQGYRPDENGKFILKDGVFYKIVEEARKEYERAVLNKEEPAIYCMIIDEINRGNLSKVFGELMMLIESDKRDSKWSVKLTYSDDDFYIPKNLFIIGTMNTADRSLADIDYALRRRFAFINMESAFSNSKCCEKFRKFLIEKDKVQASFVDRIINAYTKLNNYLVENLDERFEIGHSYFIGQFEDPDEYDYTYNCIVQYEILPLLKEYFYDDKSKYEEAKKIIENI